MIDPMKLAAIAAGLLELKAKAEAGELFTDDMEKISNFIGVYTDSHVGWAVRSWLETIAKYGYMSKERTDA